MLSDTVPQLLKASFFVAVNDLLVASAQIQGHLGTLKPLLHRLLALHVSNVLLESLLLDSECLEDAQHLHHGFVVFALATRFDGAISTDTLNLVDFLHFHGLGLGRFLHHGLRHHKLRQNLLFSILSPSEPCFAEVTILES